MNLSVLLVLCTIHLWVFMVPSVTLAVEPVLPKEPSHQEPTKPVEAQQAKQGRDKEAKDKEAEENRQKEAEEAKRLTELFLRSQSVFIRKGELMLELNAFYSRNARLDFVQVGGGAVVAHTTRRFFDNTIIARYGLLTDGLELDVIAPVFIRAEQETDFGVGRVRTVEEGVGDLTGALRYQVWYERGSRPSLILDVNGKSRTGGSGLTGTGVWNAGGGVTLLKTIDPVVLFGRIGYTYNFARPGRDLGNILDYRLGMGFSLNDRVSFMMQLTGAVIEPSKISAVEVTGAPGTTAGAIPVTLSTQRIEIMNLLFTTTILVTKQFFIEPVVGVGLTESSFSLVGIRIPYRF